jgi:hypothetical protein
MERAGSVPLLVRAPEIFAKLGWLLKSTTAAIKVGYLVRCNPMGTSYKAKFDEK